MILQKKVADMSDPFAQLATLTQDKRFLGQLEATKAAFDKGDWRGVTLGCRMLYRIAVNEGIQEQVDPIARPVFDQAVIKFEESRRTAKALRHRIRVAARKLEQFSRLATVVRRIIL